MKLYIIYTADWDVGQDGKPASTLDDRTERTYSFKSRKRAMARFDKIKLENRKNKWKATVELRKYLLTDKITWKPRLKKKPTKP